MPWIIKVPFLVPTWAAAQTWGPIILVNNRYALTTKTLAHELRHYVQSMWFGFILWPAAYLVAWAIGGFSYRNNWFEKDARNHSVDPRYVKWAQNTKYPV